MDAVTAGDLAAAKKCFLAAVKDDAAAAPHRFHLAVVLAALGDRAAAAEHVTVSLRLDPNYLDAARRLAALFAVGVLDGKLNLDPVGLHASLGFDTVDRDLLAGGILQYLASRGQLRRALDEGRRDGWLAAARRLCRDRNSELFKQPLLHEVLRRGIVCRRDVEGLLTAVRAVLLLEIPRERLQEPVLAAFATALADQCRLNGFVWAESAAERDALRDLVVDRARLAAGGPAAGAALLVACMYRRPEAWLGAVAAPDVSGVVPAAFRDRLTSHLNTAAEIKKRGLAVPEASQVSDATSLAVAGQYEHSPYPPWTCVNVSKPGAYLTRMQHNFKPGQLDFKERPFDVLVAGCGTGRLAVSAALDYGANARVVGLDITRASLGYASLMTERLGVPNLTFARGDLKRLAEFEPSYDGRFHVVECSGVLHHLADPFSAWQALVKCLAPGGIMFIGLYSQTARQNLMRLRGEPEFPGSHADDEALRDYRAVLSGREGAWPGAELTHGIDFYSASGFRDYFLHVNEHTMTLPEIERFLDRNGLEFRGFVHPPFPALQKLHPSEKFPGSLANWADWESRNPRAFAHMYQFWCTPK
jgi:SAM-dependent methyltransferase